MAEIRTYKDLDAWRVGMDTVALTYEVTADFPAHERYGLVSQMRRAAVSIPSNLAEGQAIKQSRWALRYVSTAIGSSLELDTQLEIALRLALVSPERAKTLANSIDRIQKLLYGMRRERMNRVAATAGAIVVTLAVLSALV